VASGAVKRNIFLALARGQTSRRGLNSVAPPAEALGKPPCSVPHPELAPMPTPTALPKMSNAAFAGFLRLLLTPLSEAPAPSKELGAYLKYLNRVYPRDGAR
jgi:hypothetical protein